MVFYLSDALVEDVFANMSIHSTEDIVQQHNVGVRVDRPRQANPLLLPSRQVHPLLADLRLVSRVQDFEILRGSFRHKQISTLYTWYVILRHIRYFDIRVFDV